MLTELDLSQVEQIVTSHVNEILDSCKNLKVLDLYGTSVSGLELKVIGFYLSLKYVRIT